MGLGGHLSAVPLAPSAWGLGPSPCPRGSPKLTHGARGHLSAVAAAPAAWGYGLLRLPDLDQLFADALQLAAGGEYVAASRFTQVAGNRFAEDALKAGDTLCRRRGEGNAGAWIQGDQVHFAVQVPQHAGHAARVSIRIIDAAQQYVFERELFPRPQRISPARV